MQALRNPEDFIASCEACWRPGMLLEGSELSGSERGIAPSSPAGLFLRRCRLAFNSMPFEVRSAHLGLLRGHALPMTGVQSSKAPPGGRRWEPLGKSGHFALVLQTGHGPSRLRYNPGTLL